MTLKKIKKVKIIKGGNKIYTDNYYKCDKCVKLKEDILHCSYCINSYCLDCKEKDTKIIQEVSIGFKCNEC